MLENTTIVDTKKGPVKGVLRTSVVGEKFYRFRGIPYAKPPIGDLRFKDPQPIEPWNKVLDATKQGPTAIGLNFVTFGLNEGCSEDCLTLNVYTKEITPRRPLPVMVWIHGGAFRYGDTTEYFYGPDYLLEKDVVFVSINYRLGALGFLSMADPSVNIPGNAGLKDQTLALHWVRENIHFFGGDNKNITLFGESAGGASVHWHMLSEFSRGLFDKAIVQSGSALSDWTNIPQLNWAERLAKHMGWNEDGGSVGCYEFLKNLDAVEIVKEQEKIMTNEEKKMWIFSPYGPTIEPYVSEQTFFTKDPLELYKSCWGNKIPLIIGGNSDEGILWYQDLVSNPGRYDQEGFENLFSFQFGVGSEKTKLCAEKTKQFYYGEEQPSAQNISKFMDILADRSFLHGINLAVKGRIADPESAPTYLYRFSFDSDTDFTMIKNILAPNSGIRGVCHAEELEYLFKTSFSKPVIVNSVEHKTIDRLVSSWTRFAATNDPNNDAIKPTYWKTVAKGAQQPYDCLNISVAVTLVAYPEAKRVELWDSFFNETSTSKL